MVGKRWKQKITALFAVILALFCLTGAVSAAPGDEAHEPASTVSWEEEEESQSLPGKEYEGDQGLPQGHLLQGGRSNIVVTTPQQIFVLAGYRSVFLEPDGQMTETGGISGIPLHFHYGSDGNTAFCLGVNLANPDGSISYGEADLDAAYGEKLEQVSAIVQNSILKFSDDRQENVLPQVWQHLSYEDAQYAAQLAIWNVLLGTPGNEPEMDGNGWFNDAWLYQNVYFPRLENLEDGSDVIGFYEYLLETETVKGPGAACQLGQPVYGEGEFRIPLTVRTEEASGGTVLEVENCGEQPWLLRADQTQEEPAYDSAAGVYRFSWAGSVDEEMTLVLPAAGNDDRSILLEVFAKSNAVSSNLVYLIPSASDYQNLIKVEPREVETVSARGQVQLPKVTADGFIEKKDMGSHLPMEKVRFHIWSDQGMDQIVETAQDGRYTLENLLPGQYYYQEQPVAGYVGNGEIYSFTVDQNGEISGEIGAGEVPFTVENLRYCDVTVVKKIKKDDIVWAHGNPIFLFSVEGEDLRGIRHTYWGSIVFTEEEMDGPMDEQGYISQEYTFRNIPMGSAYRVTEEQGNRYHLEEVSSEDSNVSIQVMDPSSDGEKEWRIVADLRQKPEGTRITFVNEKVRNDGYSDTSLVKNRIPLAASQDAVNQ